MSDVEKSDVGKLVDELRRENPKFDTAAAEVELVRKVGDTLERMRVDANLTQEQMGKRLGISASRVSQLESGTLRDAPNLKTLARYASECGQSFELVPLGMQPEREKRGTILDAVDQGFAMLGARLTQQLAEQSAKQLAELKKANEPAPAHVGSPIDPTWMLYPDYGVIKEGRIYMGDVNPVGSQEFSYIDCFNASTLSKVELATQDALSEAGLGGAKVRVVGTGMIDKDQFRMMVTVDSSHVVKVR